MARSRVPGLLITVIFLSFPPLSLGAAPGGTERWTLSLRGGYDPTEYAGQHHSGAIYVSTSRPIGGWTRLVLETGFHRYIRYNSGARVWFMSGPAEETRRVTDVVPVSIGFRLAPAIHGGSRPYLEILPTFFHARQSQTLTLRRDSGSLEIVQNGSGWTPGLQLGAGFETSPMNAKGLEFGLRLLLTEDNSSNFVYYRYRDSSPSESSVYDLGHFELNAMRNLVIHGGISLSL